jgi:hypothetical protein
MAATVHRQVHIPRVIESGGIENATHNTFHDGFDSNTFICHDCVARLCRQ